MLRSDVAQGDKDRIRISSDRKLCLKRLVESLSLSVLVNYERVYRILTCTAINAVHDNATCMHRYIPGSTVLTCLFLLALVFVNLTQRSTRTFKFQVHPQTGGVDQSSMGSLVSGSLRCLAIGLSATATIIGLSATATRVPA
jgi:hypothetical protein